MSEERVIQTACVHDCPGFCLLKAHVRDGVIVRFSSDSSGADTLHRRQLRACARGLAYRQRVYHHDRLLHPLVRVGERGDGRFRQATWDEALEIAAAGIRRVKERHGNESLFVMPGSGHQALLRGNVLARRLLGMYGGCLNHHNNYSLGCTADASIATFGTAETGNSHSDFVNSKLIILWSANYAWTSMASGAPWYLSKAKEAGAKIVCIDPQYTDTAVAFADEWIPIYPGTDNAMMDAMAYVMIAENLHDRPFLDRYCMGFDEAHLPSEAPVGSSYENYVLGRSDHVPKTPAWAEAITGVPAETITSLAREYATTKPAALVQGWGQQRAAYGEQPPRGGAVLAAMTGNVGISGGWAGGAGLCGRQIRLKNVPAPNPIQASIPVFLWTDAITRGKEMGRVDGVRGVERLPSNIKLILNVQGNLLINQHANINRTVRTLRDTSLVEFILVADQFLTPSARFADVVFPATTWLEREDVISGAGFSQHVLFLNKAIEPLGEAKSDYWAMSRLAERLGIEEAFTEGRDEEGWLRHLIAASDVPDYDTLKREGRYQPEPSSPHVAFSDFRRDPEAYPLATPSGKIEIYTQAAAEHSNPSEVPAVPKYVPSWEGRHDSLRGRFPLQLLTPHPKFRTHSTLANVPWLREISTDAVFINPVDATPRGISDGERVRVWNDRGATLISARVTERIMPGVVAIQQGSWYSPRGDGVDEGGCANVLTSSRPSPWTKGNTQSTSLVQIAKEPIP